MRADDSFGNLCLTWCSAAEYVIYKLKEIGKIEQSDVVEMLKEFEVLDRDHTGALNLSEVKNSSRITQTAHAA